MGKQSRRIRSVEGQLGRVAAPPLAASGFEPSGVATFQRRVEHEGTLTTQIVEFQVGRKGWSLGKFTVNLGVLNLDALPTDWPSVDSEPRPVDCLSDLTRRLGFLREPRRGFVARLLGRSPDPTDYWWTYGTAQHVNDEHLSDAMGVLLGNGVRWLNSRTSIASFTWALRQLERRKEWKAVLGRPGSARLWTPEPFPTSR